jgi:enoyl-CoA hydratase/carnithine racemase
MCTLQQRGRIFILTLIGDGEHRLGQALISLLRSAVASTMEAAAKAGPGCVLVAVGEGRFFSNGLDIGWAGTFRTCLNELVDALRPLAADLLALPMPTVTAVTGHASAGGCLVALCHDNRGRLLSAVVVLHSQARAPVNARGLGQRAVRRSAEARGHDGSPSLDPGGRWVAHLRNELAQALSPLSHDSTKYSRHLLGEHLD